MSVTGGGGGVPVARPRSAAMTRASAGHQGGAFTVSAERVPDVKIDAASRVLHQNASNTVGENRGGRRSADTWTRLCGSSWGQKSGAGHLKTRGRVPWTMEFASGRGGRGGRQTVRFHFSIVTSLEHARVMVLTYPHDVLHNEVNDNILIVPTSALKEFRRLALMRSLSFLSPKYLRNGSTGRTPYLGFLPGLQPSGLMWGRTAERPEVKMMVKSSARSSNPFPLQPGRR